MPPQITSAASAEHYKWGGADGNACDGWHLVRAPELSIIEERMLPGTTEARHSHRYARQFFFVLEGELKMEIEHQEYLLAAGQGIEVVPGENHQAIQHGVVPLRMLVISQPPSHGDRVLA